MRNIILLAVIVFASCSVFAQEPEKIIIATEDPYNLYSTNDKDSTTLFYYKFVPKKQPIATLVILPGGGETLDDVLKQITLHKLAIENDILVILPSVNWGTVKRDEEHKFLDVVFKQVVEQHHVPKDKFVLGGFSGGGMLALTYTEKANRTNKSTFLKPRAVFGVDPPLDYAHLWNHAKRDVERNFSEPAIQEGRWIMAMYTEEFGGSPEQFPENYLKYSIYSHNQSDGGNAKFLKDTPIRIYTEPGIEWQMKNRHRDFYDLNSTDISAMINLLQLQGNKDAEIIVTYNKGKRLNGMIHPHSWSIMDSQDCFNWIYKNL
jgi:pimeloyl-ACP methyl ester carboxylesterase